MLGKQPSTMAVAFKRATFIAGERKEVGAVMTLAYPLAAELIHAGKAERVVEKAPEAAASKDAPKPNTKAKE